MDHGFNSVVSHEYVSVHVFRCNCQNMAANVMFSNIGLFHTGNSVRGALTTEQVRETLCTNTQCVDCVWCPSS